MVVFNDISVVYTQMYTSETFKLLRCFVVKLRGHVGFLSNKDGRGGTEGRRKYLHVCNVCCVPYHGIPYNYIGQVGMM